MDKHDLFIRRWVCQLARGASHAEASCVMVDPHTGWGCGWYWEASLRDTPEVRAMLTENQLAVVDGKEEENA